MKSKLFYIFVICFLTSISIAQEGDNVSKVVEGTVKEEKGRVIENEKLVDVPDIMERLREKEKALDTREADLNARQARLDTMQQDILNREDSLKVMRKEVTDRLEELKGVEDVELDKLAKIYSSAKPKSAAAIFVKMDVEKSVSIFRRMNPSAAGKILNEMGKLDPNYASRLSEGLTPQPVFSQP